MSLSQQNLDRLKIDRESHPVADEGRRWKWAILPILILLLGALWFGLRSGILSSALELRSVAVREEAGSASGGFTVLNASGYVTPRREATVSAKMTGKVVEVLVEEGKRVEANQVLARLDATNLSASRRLAEAQLQSARLNLKETEAQLTEARLRYERSKRLVSDRITTTAELEKAESDYKSLDARLERLASEVVVAGRTVEVWDQQIEDTVIRAPFAGIVTAKNAQPGEVISPMSAGGFTRTGICTLVDMDSIEIEVEVNESYLNRVTPGQKVEATLDAYADWKIPAHVIAIIPTADRQKATVKVRVAFEKKDPRMLPQMGVKVAFRSEDTSASSPRSRTSRMLIPRSALQERDGKQIVWLIKEGRLERRAIAIAPSIGDEVEVLSGLVMGDRVVVEPPLELKEGAKVRARP